MPSLQSRLFLPALLLAVQLTPKAAGLSCRNLPGDPNFPSPAVWDTFNASIGGRLVAIVPSAKFCHELPAGQCGEDMWESTVFRAGVPGAMDNVGILRLRNKIGLQLTIILIDQLGAGSSLRNIVPHTAKLFIDCYSLQDYLSNPPSLCLQNGTQCGQGNVPVFGINATEASHFQVGENLLLSHSILILFFSFI